MNQITKESEIKLEIKISGCQQKPQSYDSVIT